MLSSKAGGAEAKLVDFGLHKVLDERLKVVLARVRRDALPRAGAQVGAARGRTGMLHRLLDGSLPSDDAA
jgi:hypothetical protein